MMLPDLPDSDELIIYLILERVSQSMEKAFAKTVLDLNKKSEIWVKLT